jgi:hypothetical protein
MILSGYWPQISFAAVFSTVLYLGWQNIDEEPIGEDAKHDARVKNGRMAIFAV